VGGTQAVRVNVRVVAATNANLRAATEGGRFREDLFYRLNVLPIHIPPLRSRLEDIPGMVDHLMERLRSREGMNPPEISPHGMAALRRYPWPGNVRELANVCERLAILHPGARVDGAELEALLPATGQGALSLTDQLDAFERRQIETALAAAGGSVAEAARGLRTDRANLYRRMKRLGLQR
jgi:two-component system, NtrC family, nitrogen regulation response regulator NtrX